jgi:WD40 repeat protein
MLDRECNHKYLLASGGADGIVKVWSAANAEGKWTCLYTLDHGALDHKSSISDDQEREPPQVYTIQFIAHWKGIAAGDSEFNNFLMTSSDDFVHLWEIALVDDGNSIVSTGCIKLVEVMSIRFTCLDDFGYGVSVKNVTSGGLSLDNKENTSSKKLKTASEENARVPFGGERNPHNIVYVFDAQYCLANGLLGVALSDGSLRLVNGRGVCVAPVTLPGNNSHLTSFCWDATGARLASCVATGHLILWDIHIDGPTVKPSCKAVLEGGHMPGRPLYGAAYCGGGESQDLVLSWGVDGRLCLWDSHSESNIHAPISTLVAKSDYPLYAVDVDMHHSDDGDGNSQRIARVGCGGGGFGDAGILGVPTYLFDVRRGHPPSTKEENKEEVAKSG